MMNRRGSAFVLAMTFVLASLWALAVFHSHIRAAAAVREGEKSLFAAGPIQAGLAKAVALLETGAPASGYTCKTGATPVALVFTNTAPLEWDLVSSTEDFRVDAATCACPSVFYSSSAAHLWDNCS
ncbi:MAG: hypothetical protein WC421_04775 [Elusimicrobiales bacterium]